METIYAVRRDGTRVTYEGTNLSRYWTEVSNDSEVVIGDYYKPGNVCPRVLFSYFGSM